MPSVTLDFRRVHRSRPDTLAFLTLSRPQAANALDEEMIAELARHLKALAKAGPECRATILRAEGKHFCSGADLAWMKKSAKLTRAANARATAELSAMFESLFRLPMPTIAVAHGAVYGGGVGLVAACDFAIADEATRFCLSEVKIGLVPAVIFPYVQLKVARGALSRFVLGARVFTAQEALVAGLVQRAESESELPSAVDDECARLLEGEPGAQRAFKRYQKELACGKEAQWNALRRRMATLLAQVRAGRGAQAGLAAFFARETPEWKLAWPPAPER